MLSRDAAFATLGCFRDWDLVADAEITAAARLFDPGFAFAAAMAEAETFHVHVKVDELRELPRQQILAAGGEVEYHKEGFVKFRFGGGTNLIFSSIPVSQDELVETACTRRPRPFVDHF